MKPRVIFTFSVLMCCALLAAACGGSPAAPAAPAPAEAAAPTAQPVRPLPSGEGFVVGYEADEKQDVDGLLKACAETKMECVRGKDINELVNKGVDAIISFSNKWHVYGAWPQIQNAKEAQIPIFMLNADSAAENAHNLSTLYSSTRAGLEWMMAEMGGEGEFVYFNFGPNGFLQDIIDEVLAANPKVKATAMPANYENRAYTKESIMEMVKANPQIKAIWTSEYIMDIFWAAKELATENIRIAVLSENTMESLDNWKLLLEEDPDFKAFTTIAPGGVDSEAVYAALFHLSGMQFNPDALGGKWGNTFLYDYPIITSENLNEWLGKLDTLQVDAKGQTFSIPAMSADEIRTKWFVE